MATVRRLGARLLLFAGVLAVGAGCLFVLRNELLERGASALKKGDGSTALRYLKPPAYLGDKISQMLIGDIYAYGKGQIPESEADALYWFHRAGPILPGMIAEGCIDSAASYALDIAKSYLSGEGGVKVDLARSRKWLKVAANGGCNDATAMLAGMPE